MSQDVFTLNGPINASAPDATQKRVSQKGKGRKFFQQLQPTFAIELPRTTVKLEFLDENDPAKDTIVRKKAREWVNNNRENSIQARRRPQQSRNSKKPSTESAEQDEVELLSRRPDMSRGRISPLHGVRARSLDPFNILPDIGREYGHIIDYFLTSCPEEIPCSDDKYARTADKSVVKFSRENTVLGNMVKSQVSFILWLYATVTIRDGIVGSFATEEVFWYYNQALVALQDVLRKETESGKYSDDLIHALACITATASFSGMFSVAVLHRNAMVRILRIRGDGDVLKGIYSLEKWGRKAIQWCEIMVATQIVEVPHIPYFHPYEEDALPENIISEAEALTTNTLANLPPLSTPLQNIIRLLHRLGVCYANQTSMKKIDPYIIQPLYDAVYALLSVSSAHKEKQCLSDVEVLLAETFQLYFWTGPRVLPPQTRLCDLLISRIMKALLPLLLEKVPEDAESLPVTARGFSPSNPNTAKYMATSLHHPTTTNNAIVWSLALGTMVSTALGRPEYWWLRGHLHLYVQAMHLNHNEESYHGLLKLFPATNGFSWINLQTLYQHFPSPSTQPAGSEST